MYDILKLHIETNLQDQDIIRPVTGLTTARHLEDRREGMAISPSMFFYWDLRPKFSIRSQRSKPDLWPEGVLKYI